MKTKLIVVILSAAVFGVTSSAALARGEGSGSRPGATHAQQRDWGRNQAIGHRDVGAVRHSDRRMDRKTDHGGGWSHHHPRARHGWSQRRPHDRYALRGRHYYPIPRGHFSARPYHHSSNGLIIIFHGHY
jgi:hypothetical protein